MYLFSLLNMDIQLFVYDNLFSELYFGCHCPCGTHLSGSFLTSVLTLMCICGCIWGLCCRGYKCIGFLPDFPGAWWSGSCVCVGGWWLVCMSGPLVSHTLMVFYVVFLAPLFEIPYMSFTIWIVASFVVLFIFYFCVFLTFLMHQR